jgi:Cu2+-exporting ATPase
VHLVLAQGLERYYQFRSGTGAMPPRPGRDWSGFDREASLRRYTHLRSDGERELSLQIDGLHCTACGWLIENSLRRLAGVSSVHVSAGSGRAELRFQPSRVTLSRVLERIDALGFQPHALSFSAAGPDGSGERREALKRLAIAGFGMMEVMTYAVAMYAGALQGIAPDIEQLLRFVSLVVATPVALYSARPFYDGAWRSLRARTLGMDVPVALSIASAYLWSVVAVLRGHGAVYFDSVVMFTFFLAVGRYAEMTLRHRAGLQQDAFARMLPDSVLRIVGEQTERVLPEELVAGDRVRVLAGERVPADGEVLSGATEVDESLLTGESAPQVRGPHDTLVAGSLNLSGVVELRVLRVGQDSTLAAISRLLERARASRPRFVALSDRAASWFIGGVLIFAVAVGIYWLHADPARAFPCVLAVLVVTCPCALSLAAPAALASATTRLARAGLLVTGGRALERLARADRIVFDKTGTLTRGRPRIQNMRPLSARAEPERCRAIAAALERYSEHPLARAFAALPAAPNLRAVHVAPGRGLSGELDGVRYRIGRADYVLELCRPASSARGPGIDAGRTDCIEVILGDEAGPLAQFLLSDSLREDAHETLTALAALGLSPIIASGDVPAIVALVARRLGVASAHGGLQPADKLSLVRTLQAAGHGVAMVGDGVNDAPVLAAADVSIAIGSGTELAKVSADLILPGDALAPLIDGLTTARRMRRIIRQNLGWAILYNATAMPFAAAGWLAPWVAAAGMSLSSLLVVLNAMRLLGEGTPRAPTLGLQSVPVQAARA